MQGKKAEMKRIISLRSF